MIANQNEEEEMTTNQGDTDEVTTNQNGESSANENNGVVSTEEQENVAQQDVSNFTFDTPMLNAKFLYTVCPRSSDPFFM